MLNSPPEEMGQGVCSSTRGVILHKSSELMGISVNIL